MKTVLKTVLKSLGDGVRKALVDCQPVQVSYKTKKGTIVDFHISTRPSKD